MKRLSVFAIPVQVIQLPAVRLVFLALHCVHRFNTHTTLKVLWHWNMHMIKKVLILIIDFYRDIVFSALDA